MEKPAAPPAAQPATDIDAAGAIPEDNFTQYVSHNASVQETHSSDVHMFQQSLSVL